MDAILDGATNVLSTNGIVSEAAALAAGPIGLVVVTFTLGPWAFTKIASLLMMRDSRSSGNRRW